MFGRLSKLAKAYRAASHWNNALDKASQKNYAAALICLRSVYDVFETNMPSDRVDCEVNILCANVACKLDDYNLSVAAAIIAMDQLKHDARELSTYDRDYLGVYCRKLLEYCAFKTKDDRVADLAVSIAADFDPVLLPKVHRHILRKFPITGLQ